MVGTRQGTWYYLNGAGEMQTGWLQDNGTWYYLEASGAMKASQWFEVDGKWILCRCYRCFSC